MNTAILIVLAIATHVRGGEGSEQHTSVGQPRYFDIVRDYTVEMIEHGRDNYGPQHSPLVAVTLDRSTQQLPEGWKLHELENLERASWGIRNNDRMLSGANPMHDQNLYQVLYALSEVTGERRFGREADRTLTWFFRHCQSETTGLMAWGEHIGWDFFTETIIGDREVHNHEFFRPWVLWNTSFMLAPESCAAFAHGLWHHQISDQQTGDFSRHAGYKAHTPGRNSQYPRHGGFYISTWAEAYQHTGDTVFLHAIEVLAGFFDIHRHPASGAIPAEVGHPRSNNRLMWPQSNLSLAIDLHNAAQKVPDTLARQMLALASSIDSVYHKTAHNVHSSGRGFVVQGNIETLKAEDVRNSGQPVYTDLWATGYGQSTDAAAANTCFLRYRQTQSPFYRKKVLATADRYLETDPDLSFPLYPGTMGDVMYVLMDAYQISGDARYLDRADHMGQMAFKLFFEPGNPLPKASSHHEHYEAITRADTMIMAFLRLWCIQNEEKTSQSLVWCDR